MPGNTDEQLSFDLTTTMCALTNPSIPGSVITNCTVAGSVVTYCTVPGTPDPFPDPDPPEPTPGALGVITLSTTISYDSFVESTPRNLTLSASIYDVYYAVWVGDRATTEIYDEWHSLESVSLPPWMVAHSRAGATATTTIDTALAASYLGVGPDAVISVSAYSTFIERTFTPEPYEEAGIVNVLSTTTGTYTAGEYSVALPSHSYTIGFGYPSDNNIGKAFNATHSCAAGVPPVSVNNSTIRLYSSTTYSETNSKVAPYGITAIDSLSDSMESYISHAGYYQPLINSNPTYDIVVDDKALRRAWVDLNYPDPVPEEVYFEGELGCHKGAPPFNAPPVSGSIFLTHSDGRASSYTVSSEETPGYNEFTYSRIKFTVPPAGSVTQYQEWHF